MILQSGAAWRFLLVISATYLTLFCQTFALASEERSGTLGSDLTLDLVEQRFRKLVRGTGNHSWTMVRLLARDSPDSIYTLSKDLVAVIHWYDKCTQTSIPVTSQSESYLFCAY
jgi:hypothetical protein